MSESASDTAERGVTDALSAYPNYPRQVAEFRLLRPLGHGAMGQVFLARDTFLDRRVALKFLATVEADAAARGRFYVEGRAVARLQHPNVVTLYRIGEEQGRPYLVSEFVHGQSLDHRDKPLPYKEVLRIALGIARGLSAAHQHGVLHRDIKPAKLATVEKSSLCFPQTVEDFGELRHAKRVPMFEHCDGSESAAGPPTLGDTFGFVLSAAASLVATALTCLLRTLGASDLG